MNDLILHSPFHPLWRMQNEVERMFNGLLPQQDREEKATTAVWSPRADLAENDEAYRIILDLPGVPKNEVTINYHEGKLIVSGERKQAVQNEAKAIHVERSAGHFYRDFKLPKSVNAGKIEATCIDGVLTIVVPKAEASKPHRIKVK